MMLILGLILLAYLMGSVPTAVWVSKLFYGFDIREKGSGNAGATNVFRILGKKAGIPVLLTDILKGYCAVQLDCFSGYETSSSNFIQLQLALGLAAFFGHVFPVFAQFRGGKGIATWVGVIFALHPQGAALSVLVFCIIYGSSQIVSLGSMTAGIAFPFLLFFVFSVRDATLLAFATAIAVLVLFTHRKNISRLIGGVEPKTPLKRTK